MAFIPQYWKYFKGNTMPTFSTCHNTSWIPSGCQTPMLFRGNTITCRIPPVSLLYVTDFGALLEYRILSATLHLPTCFNYFFSGVIFLLYLHSCGAVSTYLLYILQFLQYCSIVYIWHKMNVHALRDYLLPNRHFCQSPFILSTRPWQKLAKMARKWYALMDWFG